MVVGFRLTSEELNTEHYACLARATLRWFQSLAWSPRVEGYDAAFGPNLAPLEVRNPAMLFLSRDHSCDGYIIATDERATCQ